MSKPLAYSTGGFASIEIARPLEVCFQILSNVNLWPQINKGISIAVTPDNVILAKNVKFSELISSPTPGVQDWQNEWLVDTFIPNEKFILLGVENFASTPIHSKLTYSFSKKTDEITLFERSIEVTLNDYFVSHASKVEIEALYYFLGSQWEMANHLKRFVELIQ